jgi:hypothetical protein
MYKVSLVLNQCPSEMRGLAAEVVRDYEHVRVKPCLGERHSYVHEDDGMVHGHVDVQSNPKLQSSHTRNGRRRWEARSTGQKLCAHDELQ